MNINHLHIFLDTTQTLNFSETAQRMHVSQSTVSKYIHDLEKELDVVIFNRQGTRLQLSQAGKALIPWAKRLVGEYERFQEMAQSLHKEVAGPLRIACTTAAGKYVLPLLAVRYRKRFPNVDISMLSCRPSDVDDFLREGKADIAVVSYETVSDEWECQLFFYDRIILIAPPDHPWASQVEIQPDDLIQEPMIIREPTSGTRRALLSALAAHDISLTDLNIVLELGNAESIVAAVAAGIGVAFVSHASTDFALEAGRVKEIPIAGFDLKRRICMMRHSNLPSSRAAEVYWGFIHDPENADIMERVRQ